MAGQRPVVGTRYDIAPGEHMEVIAIGTRGIVVEYTDGRVELVEGDRWQLRQREVTRRSAMLKENGLRPR